MATYYQRIVGSVATAQALQMIADAGALAAAHGLVARGAKYDAIVVRLIAELNRAGIESAEIADAAIRAALDATRSGRPTNTGALRAAIKSRPLATAVPLAAIGIASIEELDKVTNPRSGGIYWRAQEWGWNLTPRIVPGYFMPGFSAPDAAEAGQHPYFQQMQYSKGMPALNIVDTIKMPARQFLAKGAAVGVAANLRMRLAAERKAITALRSV